MKTRLLSLLVSTILAITTLSANSYVEERTRYLKEVVESVNSECPIDFIEDEMALSSIQVRDKDVVFSFSISAKMYGYWYKDEKQFGALWIDICNKNEINFAHLCAECEKDMVIRAFSNPLQKAFSVKFTYEELDKMYNEMNTAVEWLKNFVAEKKKELPERVDEDTLCESISFDEDMGVRVDYKIYNLNLYDGLTENKEITYKAFREVIDEDEELTEVARHVKKAKVGLCFRLYYGKTLGDLHYDIFFSPYDF